MSGRRIVSARGGNNSARGADSAKGAGAAGGIRSDFEDIVPIVDDDEGEKFNAEIHVGEMINDSMDFEPVIMDDADESG